MKSIKLAETRKKNYALVAITEDNDKVYQYAVVCNYKPNEEFGRQWDFGNYAWTLEDAYNILRYYEDKPSTYRLEEISGQALHWIEDEYDDLIEFEDNYDLQFTEDELLFFGLDRYIDC